MQEASTTAPVWLKPGYFIDLKDKQGDWRVAIVLNLTKTQIRVRYEGWSSKFDQNFLIGSSSIRSFRSVIRGYTGQVDSPPPRQHYKFTESTHKENYQQRLTTFIDTMQSQSEFEINQFIRGSHYSWIEYLMTLTYNSKDEITLVFQYFFKHFELLSKYIRDLLACESFEQWINGTNGEGSRAFADAYFEIFDSVYAIMDGYPRLKNFTKQNAALIADFIAGYNSYQSFMSHYLQEIGVNQLIEKLILKLLSDKKSVIPLNFTIAFTRLFSVLDKTVKQPQKRKELAMKICELILRECSKMSEISAKEQQSQLQKIYAASKLLLLKHGLDKDQFLFKFQTININSWKCMILSQKLQRKVKAINNLRVYFANLNNSTKKSAMMIFHTRETFLQELKKQEILNAIFYQNEHHEIIKKGCELMIQLYRERLVGEDELELVWKSCRHRLEAVRKIMYVFFEEIAKDLKAAELKKLVLLISNDEFTQELDKAFFYSFLRRLLESATVEKAPIIEVLLSIAETRVMENKDDSKLYSELLTMSKSLELNILSKFARRIIGLIAEERSNESTIFYLALANEVFSYPTATKLDFSGQTFNIVFGILCNVLKQKVNKGTSPEQYQSKREKLNQLLKLMQFLENIFDFQIHEFTQIWKLFNQQYNRDLRELEFLPWILHISHTGLLKWENLKINKCLYAMQKDIFATILRKHENIDYISLTEFEFKIFKAFLIQVNKELKNIEEQTNFLTGISYFRIKDKAEAIEGMKELFDIFLNCRNERVIAKASRLLRELHLNYEAKSPKGQVLKCKKVQELLIKIQKQIVDGMKKSNVRRIKNALFLLNETALWVKQAYSMPQEYIFNHSGLRPSKRTIKIKQNDKIVKQITVVMTNTIRSLKKSVCQILKVYPYNLRLYKEIYEYKKVEEAGPSYDDASASSAQSYDQSKNEANYSLVKTSTFDQIPNQILYGPISCLMLPENGSSIMVKQFHNDIYEQIENFVNQKISEPLLKILAEPQFYSKQSSELAYTILIEISCSNSTSFQVLTNLIKQLKTKQKMPQENNQQSIGLSEQSVNFKMYFCKNVNKLETEELKDFFDESNRGIYGEIFLEFQKQIVSPLQIELFLEIIDLVKKGINLQRINEKMLSPQKIYQCIVSLLQFNAGPKEHKEFKKEERTYQNTNELKVFLECLNIIDLLMSKNHAKFIDFIVQNQNFEKVMTLIYKVSGMKSQFGDFFQGRLEKHLRYIQILDQKTEEIMYHTIFDVLYTSVIQIKHKKNTSFFKLIKDLISVASPFTIAKLFTPKESNASFWQNCLNVISSESDFHSEIEKQNKLLSGHLLILESLIKKNPKAVTDQICQMVLFNCLFFHDEFTTERNIKCVSKNSIQAGLAVLLAISRAQEKYLRVIVAHLRKYQQTEYWRNPNFWNVNIELEMKSPCGFVGLQNPGCICYLNSFTQTLFMNEQFRNQVISFPAVDPSKDYSLLNELRKIFLNLQHSNQKYLNPVPFTKTIKNMEDQPMIKLFEQMDIEEYSSILFDKIQKLLPKERDFVKDIFGGTYSNDIISKECKHCSQREESFLSMQLDVKATLEESLRTLVKGEILEGENAYYCEKCNKKVRALKRMSIKKLPNYLIICLKRFEYNFETDQKFKVNSCCQFPTELSLEPFSQQFLSSEQQLQQFNNKIQDEAETEQIERLPREYFEYKLKGVIIHTGSSESGHYYALIEAGTGKEDGEKWFQFNDGLVSDFDVEGLPDEAFGSDDPANPRFKNAYMLVYERRKKLNVKQENMKMEVEGKNEIPPQVQKILQQIGSRNRQIQAFQTIFTPEYHTFISQIIHNSINSNLQLLTQYKQKLQSQEPIPVDDKLMLLTTNEYSQETIEEVIKGYLEYCLFVRARDINLQVFIEYLNQLEGLISIPMLQGVADYFIRELGQGALVEQLFVEVSFKDKLVILANFTCEVMLTRLRNKKADEDHVIVLVLRAVETFMSVMIKDSLCVNQLLYIIRRLADQFPYFITYFQKMDLFTFIFEIVAGISQSSIDRAHKLNRLREQTNFLIKQNFKSSIDIDGDKMTTKQSTMSMQEESQEKSQEEESRGSFEIRTVSRAGKCVLNQESPQEAWNYLYATYRHQSKLLREIEEFEGEGENQEYKMKEINDSLMEAKLIESKRLLIKRDFFESQIHKMKNERLELFLQNCQGSKAANSLALFLCEVSHENEKLMDRLLSIISKGLQKLEAIKFRSYLILLYHMVMHEDSLKKIRIQNVLAILLPALTKNAKYFSQVDIIHQWIIKLTLASPTFTEIIVRTQEGLELFNQIIERLEVQRKPTEEMIKKQKNPVYERLNYQVHGLVVSTDFKDYERLLITKKQFFTKLFHEEPIPLDIQAQIKCLRLKEPNYEELTSRPKAGQIMYYLFNRKWLKILIKSTRYGLLKVGQLVKKPAEIPKTPKEQAMGNLLTVEGSMIDLGDETIGQEFTVWQMEQRLKDLVYHEEALKSEGIQSIGNKEGSNNKEMVAESEEQVSSLSYQSSSGHI